MAKRMKVGSKIRVNGKIGVIRDFVTFKDGSKGIKVVVDGKIKTIFRK